MKAKTVIVTGAAGFLGRNVADRLLREGCKVCAAVRGEGALADERFREYSENGQLNIVVCPLEEYNRLPRLLSKEARGADAFIHLAWAGRARGCDDVQRKNTEYSQEALFAARELGCECFIGAGSQAEYGICKGIVSEEREPKPVTEYGRAKAAFTEAALRFGESAGMRVVIPRIFSLYGEGDKEYTMVMSVLEKMLGGLPVELSDCNQMWDYTYIGDAARAYSVLLEKGESGVYNLSRGEPKPLKEFVLCMKRLSGSKSELNFGSIARTSTGEGFCPSAAKLKALGWEPQTDFEEGIRRVIEYISVKAHKER